MPRLNGKKKHAEIYLNPDASGCAVDCKIPGSVPPPHPPKGGRAARVCSLPKTANGAFFSGTYDEKYWARGGPKLPFHQWPRGHKQCGRQLRNAANTITVGD